MSGWRLFLATVGGGLTALGAFGVVDAIQAESAWQTLGSCVQTVIGGVVIALANVEPPQKGPRS